VSDRAEAEKVLRMLPLKYADAPPATAPLKMPAPEDVALFRIDPEVLAMLDYTKGFGHPVSFSASAHRDDDRPLPAFKLARPSARGRP